MLDLSVGRIISVELRRRQISLLSVKSSSRYLDFGFFKMVAVTILDF